MKRVENKQQDFAYLRPVLVWRFIAFLIGTGLVEMLILSGVKRYILPLMTGLFWRDVNVEWDLTNAAMLGFLAMILLELLILAVGSFLPGSWQPIIRSISDDIEGLIYTRIPELQHAAVPRMELGKEILLFGMLLLILLFLILPIAISSGAYASLVAREIGKIEKIREKEYADLDKQRNLMLSDIAHDLRTPITTVNGYAKAIHDGMVKEEEKKQEYLEAIMNKSSRMEELIQLLFEYSKINSVGFTLHMEKGDLAELLRENIALLYGDVEAAGMELDLYLPEYFCEVNFDRLQLSRVITNLINNAIKHNEKGTTICISLRWDNFDEKYVVMIADNGGAIPEEVAEHLFEPFAVGDASRSTKGGSGLGLSIAAKVVEMHGGNLSLKTNIAGYTKAFVFELYPEDK